MREGEKGRNERRRKGNEERREGRIERTINVQGLKNIN